MKTRVLGIDFGLKRIGLALSDELKIIAAPFKTMETQKKTPETVAALLASVRADEVARGYRVEEVVVGMPYLMKGTTGLMGDEVTHFSALLTELSGLPVILWDERLTSVQAERSLREGGQSRKKRAKNVDTVAAVLILQNYLDSKSFTQ